MPDSEKSRIPFLSPQTASYFIAGGVAGAASRTVVSPLERLKIILQVQPTGPNSSYKGVWPSLAKMWREEGWRGMMAGNGINCLRIVPYSAVQFTTYERLKKLFTSNGTLPLDTPTRLLAGALAGITSVTTTYPLDLVRSRLSIASASIRIPNQPSAPAAVPIPAAAGGSNPAVAGVTMSASARGRNMSTLLQRQSPIPGYPAPPREPVPTMWGMTLKVMREEGGIRGLYRGLIPTAMGVAPYVGINFAAYERLRQIITPEGEHYGAPRKLLCGALAGTISQTLTYPFDVLRRKMQVVGMANGMLGYKYNGAIDALRTIARVEGMAGLYRGIWPNLLKVAPSIATSFFVYETVKEFLYPARPSSSSS